MLRLSHPTSPPSAAVESMEYSAARVAKSAPASICPRTSSAAPRQRGSDDLGILADLLVGRLGVGDDLVAQRVPQQVVGDGVGVALLGVALVGQGLDEGGARGVQGRDRLDAARHPVGYVDAETLGLRLDQGVVDHALHGHGPHVMLGEAGALEVGVPRGVPLEAVAHALGRDRVFDVLLGDDPAARHGGDVGHVDAGARKRGLDHVVGRGLLLRRVLAARARKRQKERGNARAYTRHLRRTPHNAPLCTSGARNRPCAPSLGSFLTVKGIGAGRAVDAGNGYGARQREKNKSLHGAAWCPRG